MDSKKRPLYLVWSNTDPDGQEIHIIYKNGDGKLMFSSAVQTQEECMPWCSVPLCFHKQLLVYAIKSSFIIQTYTVVQWLEHLTCNWWMPVRCELPLFT